LREARGVTKSNNQNPNSWKEVRKSLSLMAEKEQDQLMNERISEALDYVQKVQLYYQTLSVNKRIFVF
jgi:membrane-bound lytic murein transglycosylase MltF